MLRKKNDILLKAAFEETFAYLLLFFFPDAKSKFDFEKGFQFMDKELRELFPELSKRGGTRQADLLVKVFLQNGYEKWILVHIEIQDRHKHDFPKRMFRYYYRIYDRYETGITAIAVFTGKARPDNNLFQESLLGTNITYEYNIYHILNHTEAALLNMNNPFALVVLAAQKSLQANKLPEHELGEARLTIAKALVSGSSYSHVQITSLLFFLKNFLHISNNEINANFEKQVDLLINNKNAMGIIDTIKMLEREEGIEEGEKRKAIKFVENLLQSNNFSMAEIARLADVNEQFVRKVKKMLTTKG